MRVLHLFDLFTPRGGGTVDLLYKITSAMVRNGLQPEIWAADVDVDREYTASLNDVPVRYFDCPSHLGEFYIMPGLVKALRENIRSFDIVHLHTARSFQNILAHHYATKLGVPYVLDSHGSLPRSVQGQWSVKRPLKWLFDEIIGKKIVRDAARVVAETQVGIQEYRDFGVPEDKIVLVPPPFDTEAFAVLPEPGGFRARYGLDGQKIIMFLGRIHWIKGIDFLTEAFAALAGDRGDVRLVIVGNDDGFKPVLEELIARLGIGDRVLFTGFLAGADKLGALVDADIVIQTSRYEQGAWAPFEAVLCGTPIIVSSNSGAGEDTARIDAGYLVEYGNIGDLKEKMAYVLEHREEALDKTLKAKRYIEENMSMATGVRRYLDLYTTVCGGE